jgi:hypothetical protein
LCAEEAEELGEPGMERGPGRAGDKVTVNDSFVHRKADVGATAERNVGAGGRIGAALLTLEDSRDSENLGSMANGGERLVSF